MQKSSVKKADRSTGNKYSYVSCAGKPPSHPLIIQSNTNIDADYPRPSLSKRLLENILCSITEAFVLTNHRGLIKETNTQLLELLDYSEDELRDRPLTLIMEEDSNYLNIVNNAASEQKHCPSTTLRTRSKVLIPVDLTATPYTDETTGARYTIILTKDMRDKNRLAKELERTKEELASTIDSLKDFREGVSYMLKNLDQSETELQATNLKLRETQAQLVQTTKLKALGELTAGLAHELNQPLTVIRGLSQHLIRDFNKNPAHIEKLKYINSATQKMEKTISHLKAFSRLDDDVMISVNLNEVINNSLLLTLEILKSKQIKVALDLQNIPPVKGRPNRLEQVIINLITNARDAMPAGGTIEVASSTIENFGMLYAVVTVKDTGTGIGDDIQERIFEPFFTTKDVNEGTGLGLSISYGIIKDHRGDIWFESSTTGTTFHISIPAALEDNI